MNPNRSPATRPTRVEVTEDSSVCWDFAQDYKTVSEIESRYRVEDPLDAELNEVCRQVSQTEEERRLIENLRNHGCGAD